MGLDQYESLEETSSNDGQKHHTGMNRYERSEASANQSIFEKGDSFLASELEIPDQFKTNPYKMDPNQNEYSTGQGRGSMAPMHREKIDLIRDTNVTQLYDNVGYEDSIIKDKDG